MKAKEHIVTQVREKIVMTFKEELGYKPTSRPLNRSPAQLNTEIVRRNCKHSKTSLSSQTDKQSIDQTNNQDYHGNSKGLQFSIGSNNIKKSLDLLPIAF